MTELTDSDHDTIRNAAMGAIALVSRADPGFFAMFKESMAGSKALAAAPESVRGLFTGFGLPKPTGSTPEEMEAGVYRDVTAAVEILRAKQPEQAQGFSDVLIQACDAVANASGDVDPKEQAAIDKVRAALAAA